MSKQRLKQCPGCGDWFSWLSIVTDPYVRPLGLNVDLDDPEHGYLHFFHSAPYCNSAFVIPTREIIPDIISRPGSSADSRPESCPGHCTDVSELAGCNHECSFAPVRRLFLEMFKDDLYETSTKDEFVLL